MRAIFELAARFVELFADGSKLNAGLAAAENRVKAWGASIAKAGAGLMALGTAITAPVIGLASGAVRDFAHQMVESSSDFERARISLDNLYGSVEAGGQAFEQFKQFALVTPFSFSGVVQFAQQLRIAGVESADVLSTLKKIGDVVSVRGGDTETMNTFVSVAVKMKSMAVVHARELNQIANRGVPIWKHLAQQVGVAEENIRDFVKAGNVSGETGFKALMSLADTATFREGIARFSGTFSQLRSNLGDLFEQLAVEVGQPLFEGLKEGMKDISAFVQSSEGKAWANWAKENIALTVTWVRQNVGLLVSVVKLGFALTAAGAALVALGVAVTAAGVALGAAGRAVVLLGGHLTWLVTTPLGRLVLAVRGLSSYWLLFTKQGSDTMLKVKEAWAGFGSAFTSSWDTILKAMKSGDLESAFGVVSAAMEVEWARAMIAMEKSWNAFKKGLLDTFNDPKVQAALIAIGAVAGGTYGARIGAAFGVPGVGAAAGTVVGGVGAAASLNPAETRGWLGWASIPFQWAHSVLSRKPSDDLGVLPVSEWRNTLLGNLLTGGPAVKVPGLGRAFGEFVGKDLGEVARSGAAGAGLKDRPAADLVQSAVKGMADVMTRKLSPAELALQAAEGRLREAREKVDQSGKGKEAPGGPGLPASFREYPGFGGPPGALAELEHAVSSAVSSAFTMGAFQTGGSRAFMAFGGQEKESAEAKQLKGIGKTLGSIDRKMGMIGEAD